jgi:hypothetical protein
MAPEQDPQTLLLTFIADEDAAIRMGQWGQLWPSHHYSIRAAVSEASRYLEPADRQQLYFHLLRVTGGIPDVPDKELPHLVAGYRKLIPLLDTSAARMAERHRLLFGFGFDEEGTLADGATADAKQLKDYVKLIAHCTKYSHLPGQRAKIQNFGPYAHHGERLYQTLAHLGYCRNKRHSPEIYYDTTNLLFWGMVLVVLLHEGRRADLLRDLLSGIYLIPEKDSHLKLLHGHVQAVLPTVPVADRRFHDLAEQLATLQRERRAATESMAFARALSLPLSADEEWQIHIRIPTADNKDYPSLSPNLTCEILPDPDWQWHIRSDLGPKLSYSERTGRITQNDMNIDGLGAGHLLNFPAWIRSTETKLGIRFDVERAIVSCGRNRAVAKRVMEWLLQ